MVSLLQLIPAQKLGGVSRDPRGRGMSLQEQYQGEGMNGGEVHS